VPLEQESSFHGTVSQDLPLEGSSFFGNSFSLVDRQQSYRGTAKPTMGQPISIGQTTKQLTDKSLSVQQLAREKERELFALTHSNGERKKQQTQHSYSPLQTSEVKGGTKNLQSPSVQSSQWNSLKSGLLEKTSHSADKKRERAAKLENRQRPWPVPTTEHYQMEYSWLAQPLVTEAAQLVYREENEREREREEAEAKKKQEREEREKKMKSTLMQKVKKYNPREVSSIATLSDLRRYEKETALKIREERLNAEPIQHPYGWSTPHVNSSILS
jgi:hypothetical protein